jgi:nitrogen-specific signal transduction histidine kinase
MEVHHHLDLHHRKKQWKEYLLEFLMLFLAVTKPTGQRTGLVLSLKYNIIKRHGGEIKMETKMEKVRSL